MIALTLLVAAAYACGLASRADAAARPGSLDPSFGNDGRAIAKSTFEPAPSEFTAAAFAPDGDLVLELKRQTPGGETAREIELRSPSGALVPSFGTRGKLTVAGGGGIATLADGDILVGADECDGATSSVTMIDPSGAPVPSFGTDGCGAAVPFEVKLMSLDAQGRILLLGSADYCHPCYHDVLPSVEAVVARILPGGGRDPGFGKNGVVGTYADDQLEETLFGSGESNPTGLAASAGGGVLISKGEKVIDLDESGGLDTAFGEGGLATLPGRIGPLTVGADGNIFVVSAESSEETSSVTELDPDGTPVQSFGSGGTAPLPFPSLTYAEEEQIATTPGGGVVVGAGVSPGKDCSRSCEEAPVLTRLTATGQPDASYGSAGFAPVHLAAPSLPEPTVLRSLFIGADGSAIIAGSDESGDAFAAAFTPAGVPNGSFGESGILGEHHLQPAVLESTGLFERPDGGFTVAAQRSTAPGLRTAFLVDFDADGRQQSFSDGSLATETLAHGLIVPDGSGRPVAWGGEGRDRVLLAAGPVGRLLDATYGTNGSARFPKGLYPEEVVPAPGGGAAVVGVIKGAMAVFRVGPKGHPVPSFGHDGVAMVRFRHASSIGFAGLVEADGDVVLTGSVGYHVGATRLLPDGRLDRRFGHDGRVRRLLGRGTFGQLVAPWRGGIVIAADREATPRRAAGFVRLRPDGRVDGSFGRDGVVRAGAEKPPLALLTGAGHVVVVTDPSLERDHRGAGVELRAYRADGSDDRAFGDDGVRLYGSGTGRGLPFFPAAAIQQPDGKIVVAGTLQGKKLGGRYSEPSTKAVLVRFLLRSPGIGPRGAG